MQMLRIGKEEINGVLFSRNGFNNALRCSKTFKQRETRFLQIVFDILKMLQYLFVRHIAIQVIMFCIADIHAPDLIPIIQY